MPAWFSDPLTPGAVRVVQRKLGVPESGVQDVVFRQVVRGFQLRKGLRVTGVVDDTTAALLGDSALYANGGTPAWWDGPGLYGVDEGQVRRWQGTFGLKPTGLIDAVLAVRVDHLRDW